MVTEGEAPIARRPSGRGRRPDPPPDDYARRAEDPDMEEDDMENAVSLSAMEAELKPKVLETFDRIADAYKKLRRLQDQNVENRLNDTKLTPAQERKYKKLREEEIVTDVKSLSLNQPHRGAGRAALRHQQAPRRPRGAPDAPRRELRRRPR
jgi:RNA polymerase primary sigma factor